MTASSDGARNFPSMRHLREAHAHLAAYGQALTLPSLASCAGLAECLDAVHRAAAAARSGANTPAFVRFTAARPESWPEARWPTRAELDAAAGEGVAVVIMSFDHHTAAANSAALAAAGLRAGVAVPPSGVVCADDHGEATGVLLEHAAWAAWSAAPAPTAQERLDHVRAAAAALAAMGFTEVHDLLSDPDFGPALAALQRRGELPLRVRLYVAIDHLEAVAAGRAAWESDQIRLAGGKLFADGTLNSRTAAMLHPYRDPLPDYPCGRALLDSEQIAAAAAAARRLGLGLAVHAIGDAAVRTTLDGYEQALRETPHADHLPPLRIEHCELIDAADVPRFARLGVVCSVQPCHLLTDIEVLTRALPDRLDRVLPLRELMDSGCVPGGNGGRAGEGALWFGSDVPIVRADPEDSILAATARRRTDMPDAAAIAPRQRITQAEAWAAFAIAE